MSDLDALQDNDAPPRDDHPGGDGHQTCEASYAFRLQEEFAEAMRRFELKGIEVVEQVELIMKGKTDKKMVVKFNFDMRNDTPLLIAREMLEEHLVPNVSRVEELTMMIERAVIERCQKMTYSNPSLEVGAEAGLNRAQGRFPRQDSIDTGMPSYGSEMNAEPLSSSGHAEAEGSAEPAAAPSVSNNPEAVLIRDLSSQKHPQLSVEICADKHEDPTFQKEVRLLQTSLKYLYTDPNNLITQEGKFCDATEKALKSFQEHHKLESKKGVADNVVWDRLCEEVKKKEVKEAQKKARREEDKQKAQEQRAQKKQAQDLESAAQMEAMMGMFSNPKSAAPQQSTQPAPAVASASSAAPPVGTAVPPVSQAHTAAPAGPPTAAAADSGGAAPSAAAPAPQAAAPPQAVPPQVVGTGMPSAATPTAATTAQPLSEGGYPPQAAAPAALGAPATAPAAPAAPADSILPGTAPAASGVTAAPASGSLAPPPG